MDKDLKMLEILADHPEIFDAIDHQVRVQYENPIEDEEGPTPTTVSEDLALTNALT